ncbi:hypothetical protein T08_6441 [Trichinella sp. T8]|nr:hypothetical protein T08_6441 [Trichinella sp. T8]
MKKPLPRPLSLLHPDSFRFPSGCEISLKQRSLGKTFYCVKVIPGIYWYLRRVPTLDCWQPVEPGTWTIHSRLYLNGINNCLPSMPLWRASWLCLLFMYG